MNLEELKTYEDLETLDTETVFHCYGEEALGDCVSVIPAMGLPSLKVEMCGGSFVAELLLVQNKREIALSSLQVRQLAAALRYHITQHVDPAENRGPIQPENDNA